MIRRAVILVLWLMAGAFVVAGSILAWPHIQDTYAGAVLSGRCDSEPKPDACRRHRGPRVPSYSID